MHDKTERVAILGATPKKDRFANKAMQLLLQHGHEVIPVHPKLEFIEGHKVFPNLGAIEGLVDTLTLYVGPSRLELMIEEIIALKPGRVIFNPGTESAALQRALNEADIPWQENCTLILLNSGEY